MLLNYVTNRDLEISTLLECYAAQNGSLLLKCRDNLYVPFSRVKKSHYSTLQCRSDGLCEKTVSNCQSTAQNIPEEGRSGLDCGRSLKSCIVQILILFSGAVGSSQYSIE